MVNVNLLPEEMRKKEDQERKVLSKKPPVLSYHLTNPEVDASKGKTAAKSSGFFSEKKKEEKMIPEKPLQIHQEVPESYFQKFQQQKDDYIKKTEEKKNPQSGLGKVRFVRGEKSKVEKETEEEKDAGIFSKFKKEKPLPIPGEFPKLAAEKVEISDDPIFKKIKKEKSKKIKGPGIFGWLRSLFSREKKLKVRESIQTIPKIHGEKKDLTPKVTEVVEPPVEKHEEKKKEKPLPIPDSLPVPHQAPAQKEHEEKPFAEKREFAVTAAIKEVEVDQVKKSKKEKEKSEPKKGVENSGLIDLGINFIPDEKAKIGDQNIIKKVALSGVLIVFTILIVSGSMLFVNFYKKNLGSQIIQTNDRIESLQKQIDGFEKVVTEARHLQNLIGKIDLLLSRHLYWTKVFAALQENTIDDVYFENFSASSEGTVLLSAIGRDYESVARQLLAFENAKEFVNVVEISSASAIKSEQNSKIVSVAFSVSLKLNPEIFYITFNKE